MKKDDPMILCKLQFWSNYLLLSGLNKRTKSDDDEANGWLEATNLLRCFEFSARQKLQKLMKSIVVLRSLCGDRYL